MFKLSNTNKFSLPSTGNRAKHLATIDYGLRTFICFVLDNSRCYIEEVSGGHLERIEDDELARELEQFLKERNLLKITP